MKEDQAKARLSLVGTASVIDAAGAVIAQAVMCREFEMKAAVEAADRVLSVLWGRCPDVPQAGAWTNEQATKYVKAAAQVVLDYLEGKL